MGGGRGGGLGLCWQYVSQLTIQYACIMTLIIHNIQCEQLILVSTQCGTCIFFIHVQKKKE